MRRNSSGWARMARSSSVMRKIRAHPASRVLPKRPRTRAGASVLSALLDKRLIVVTGKGGVGKTTVSAALGLLAAALGQAGDRGRGLRAGTAVRALRPPRSGPPRGRARRRPARHLDRPPARQGGMASLPAEVLGPRRPARRQPHLPVPHGGRAGSRRARDDRQGLGSRSARAPSRRHASLRRRDRRLARHGPRRGAPARAAHLRPDRSGGADRQAGERHPQVPDRPRQHRSGRRRAAGGDAGQRDDRPACSACGPTWAWRSRPSWSTPCCPSASMPRRPRRLAKPPGKASEPAARRCGRRAGRAHPREGAARGDRAPAPRRRGARWSPFRSCSSPTSVPRRWRSSRERLEAEL